MVFPIVLKRRDMWTIKKAEHRSTDAFELWCWRRLLRVPWTARRSDQSILKEISPGCSLEGLMLKLELQYFGHLIGKADSLEKTLMLGKIECKRRRGQQRMRVAWHHQLEGHEFEQTQGDSEGQRSLACCSPQGHEESDMNTFVTITQSDSPRFVSSNTQRTRTMILLTQLFRHILQQNTGSFRF